MVCQEGDRVPTDPRHSRRLGDRGHRDVDGLREPRGHVGDRRRLHARPADGRVEVLRRIPRERAGRGRRGRDPHAAADRGAARAHAGDLRRVARHRRSPGAALQGHAGPRVHRAGRHALPLANARRQEIGARGGARGARPRARDRDRPAHRAAPGETSRGQRSDPSRIRGARQAGGDRGRPSARHRPRGRARRGGRTGRLRCRQGRRVGEGRSGSGDSRASGDLAGRRRRHVRRRGHRHDARRPHIARGGRRRRHGQGVRRGRERHPGR